MGRHTSVVDVCEMGLECSARLYGRANFLIGTTEKILIADGMFFVISQGNFVTNIQNDGNNAGVLAASPSGRDVIFCPSAQPGLSHSAIIGIVDKGHNSESVAYLPEPVAVTDSTIVAFTGSPVQATQLFRFAAPCEKGGCSNWTGSSCGVAQRVVQILPAVVAELPDCKLRPVCRWFRQEGKQACVRCPQVITDDPDFESAISRDYPPAGMTTGQVPEAG